MKFLSINVIFTISLYCSNELRCNLHKRIYLSAMKKLLLATTLLSVALSEDILVSSSNIYKITTSDSSTRNKSFIKNKKIHRIHEKNRTIPFQGDYLWENQAISKYISSSKFCYLCITIIIVYSIYYVSCMRME